MTYREMRRRIEELEALNAALTEQLAQHAEDLLLPKPFDLPFPFLAMPSVPIPNLPFK
jgi:hypothetical protein